MTRWWGKAKSGTWHALHPYKRTDEKGREYIETLCGRFIAVQKRGARPGWGEDACLTCLPKEREEWERGPTGIVKELLEGAT